MVGRPHRDRGAATASASSIAPLAIRDFGGPTVLLASGRLWNIDLAAVPPNQMSNQRVLPMGFPVFEHFFGMRTVDGIYEVGDDTHTVIVNVYSKKHTNVVRSVLATGARMPAALRFFATRRFEEALRRAIHRGFLAFCSAAIKPLPFSKVTYAKLLIKIVIRYYPVADQMARPMSEVRTSFPQAAGNALAGAIPVRCMCFGAGGAWS